MSAGSAVKLALSLAGRAALAAALLAPLPARAGDETMTTRTVVDFLQSEPAGTWRVINDGVMGGLSTSTFVAGGDSAAVFAGTVSLENNGGFASVRSDPDDYSMAGHDGILVHLRGDGRRYSLRLRTDDRFDGISYQATFETRPDEWIDVQVPFTRFEPTFRGRRVADAPPLDPAAVRQIGFLIGDKQKGPFRLEIARIEAYH